MRKFGGGWEHLGGISKLLLFPKVKSRICKAPPSIALRIQSNNKTWIEMEEIIPNRSTAHTKVLFSKQKKTCEYVQHWFSDICLQIEFLWKPRNCQILGNLKLDIGQKDTDTWYMKTSADLNQCWILDIQYPICWILAKKIQVWYMKTSADLNQCWILDIRYSISDMLDIGQKDTDTWYMKTSADLNQGARSEVQKENWANSSSGKTKRQLSLN